jgi:hypothetical protein
LAEADEGAQRPFDPEICTQGTREKGVSDSEPF